jgi:hypothetical protein
MAIFRIFESNRPAGDTHSRIHFNMHALPSLLQFPAHLGFLGFDGLDSPERLIGLVAVVGGLAIPIVAIATVFHTKQQKEKLWHETARLAIEKGQPIPARPLSEDEAKAPPVSAGSNLAEWDRLRRANRWRKDIREGLIVGAVGLALKLGGFGGDRSFLAYVPLFVGAALLLNGLINGLFPGKSDDSGDHPPQS